MREHWRKGFPARRPSTIIGYLGSSDGEFDVAKGEFAFAYAGQAESDHGAVNAAVRTGKIAVREE
jgi:hypothetical protein